MNRKQYERHAELYGVECVFERAARAGMPVGDLARLYSALRSIDRERQRDERDRNVRHRIEPVWELPRATKHALLVGLLGLGWPNRRIRAMLGVSQSTVASARRETLELPAPRGWHSDGGYEADNPHPDPALQAG